LVPASPDISETREILALGANVVAAIAGDPFPNLTPATLISVDTSFSVLGLTLAFTAWRTRNPDLDRAARS